MPGVAETLKGVIDEMTYGTEYKLINLLQAENTNLTHKDPDLAIDEPENRWSIPLVSYDTLTSRAKLSCNGQLSHYSWCAEIFDEFHRYKMKNSIS